MADRAPRTSKAQARIVKGMLNRGDNRNEIAERLKLSPETVNRIDMGETFYDLRPAPQEALPLEDREVRGSDLDDWAFCVDEATSYVKTGELREAIAWLRYLKSMIVGEGAEPASKNELYESVRRALQNRKYYDS